MPCPVQSVVTELLMAKGQSYTMEAVNAFTHRMVTLSPFGMWTLPIFEGLSESLYTTGQTMLNGVCILF